MTADTHDRGTTPAKPVPRPTEQPPPRVTRRTVAWTLTLGTLRVGLRRSEWRERLEGRAA